MSIELGNRDIKCRGCFGLEGSPVGPVEEEVKESVDRMVLYEAEHNDEDCGYDGELKTWLISQENVDVYIQSHHDKHRYHW